MGDDHLFIDYYDLLQVSPNAYPDVIRRVFRHLAKRYHPDVKQGGDPEMFRQILRAHKILTNPERRAAYDVRYQDYWDHKMQVFKDAGNGKTSVDSRELRERILTLLYIQRRTEMAHPGLGEMELARLLRVPVELLDFDLWYLRQKSLVEKMENGQLAISVAGVDHLEQSRLHGSEDHLLEAYNPPFKSDGTASKLHDSFENLLHT